MMQRGSRVALSRSASVSQVAARGVPRFTRASSRVRSVTRALFGGFTPTKTTVPALKEIKLKDIDNRPIKPASYVGKVLLVTNVASNCGFTASNYKDLVELYDRFKGRDFEILAFPCNQFGGQEPGSNQQIKDFTKKYGVEFPVTEKVDVNGPKTHPFFLYLKGMFLFRRVAFFLMRASDSLLRLSPHRKRPLDLLGQGRQVEL